jgi:hypothetical protein
VAAETVAATARVLASDGFAYPRQACRMSSCVKDAASLQKVIVCILVVFLLVMI